MLEIIYRIYEVVDGTEDNYFDHKKELEMDCIICDTREHFKDIIKSNFGNDIAFRYSKKLKEGDLYCIIIAEHCYNTERYFNKVTYVCDHCNLKVEAYAGHTLGFSPSDVKYYFFDIQDYLNKKFCCYRCKAEFTERERAKLKPNEEQEFYIQRDMFTEDIAGYIYKISKKSTGEFYIGQTQYAPVFRWGQHLKTERFPIENIMDYKFEVVEIVPKGENILEREKHWIQKLYAENPEKSLNVSNTANIAVK